MKSVAIVLVLLPLTASAATITVNSTADNTTAGDGHCTLREAIANVNTAADTTGGDCVPGSGTGDRITFSLSLPATIRLAAPKYGELAIAHELTIVGPRADLLAIDGRHRTRVFHVTAGTTTVSDLTIQNGYKSSPAYAKGGGILVDAGAAIALTNCRLIGNTVETSYNTTAPAGGGGMEVSGTATLTDCTFAKNTVKGNTGPGRGGGLDVEGNATVANSTFTQNTVRAFVDSHGGGIEVSGTATIIDSSVTANVARAHIYRHRGYNAYGAGIEVTGTATMNNCTVSDNISGLGASDIGNFGYGGGIEITGRATITGCTVSGNNALLGNGGGIEIGDTGTATLTDCVLSGNTASVGRFPGWWNYGGGIENTGSTTLTNCTLDGNSAPASGGIHNNGANGNLASLSLTDCRLSSNTGGGIGNNYGTATLTRCTLTANADGGIGNTGTLVMTDCTLSANTGGGALANAGGANATLTNCTLSGNSAGAGAGIENDGATATLINCTLTANVSYSAIWGGAIRNYVGYLTLINSTISGNSGGFSGGIDMGYNHGGMVLNSIIALNEPNNCGGEYWYPPLPSGGHNIDSDGSCFISGDTDLVNTDPVLAPLANYGGATNTMALCTAPGMPDASCTAASPAIDAADDSVTGPPDNLSTDQRGLPRLSGAHVDIGAYEVQ